MATILEHRRMIAANPTAFTQDIERLCKAGGAIEGHLRKCGVKNITKKRDYIKQLVLMLLEAQDFEPFLYIGDAVTDGVAASMVWNMPSDWDLDYIKYEWGHLRSVNMNGENAHEIENLSLQSAHCNRNVQNALNIDEVRFIGGKYEEVIDRRMIKREEMFKSERWKEIKEILMK